MWVAGVDGCRGGWLAVFRSMKGEKPWAKVYRHFEQVITERPAAIAVDIPIGLPSCSKPGGRQADIEARRLVGPERQSSVFPAPARPTIMATSHREACDLERKWSCPPKGVPQQVFHILDKIRQVDTAAKQHPGLIYECHPEVSFSVMNKGQAMQHPKRRSAGFQERCSHLYLHGYTEQFLTDRIAPANVYGRDDLADACVCAWTAERIKNRVPSLIVLPRTDDLDECNLRMAIWA
jgi:predicted RNase H-like nuclease